MYSLPNGQPIDEKVCLQALEGTFSGEAWFDVETGKVGAKGTQEERFFKLDPVQDVARAGWIEEFCTVVTMEDETLAAALLLSSQTADALRTFEDLLKQSGAEWVDAWQMWQEDMVVAEFGKWLDALPMMIDEKIEWEDDCDVCRHMQEAEKVGRAVGVEELKEVMHQANAAVEKKKYVQ